MTPEAETAGLRESFRGVAGQIASGVAVVIAVVDGEPGATTAGSVVAASFDPPLVAVLFATGSRTHGLIGRCGRFTASLLDEADHALARRFARPQRPTGWAGLRGIELRRRDPGPPVLAGAVAWVDCAVEQVVPMGDHACFVGRVLALGRRPEARPLLFYRGRLHRLGGPAAPPPWAALDPTDLAADW